MPAKMEASRTDMKVNIADAVASLANVLKVRGREQTKEMMAQTAVKTMEQALPWETVLRYMEPTTQWKPY